MEDLWLRTTSFLEPQIPSDLVPELGGVMVKILKLGVDIRVSRVSLYGDATA